MNIERTCVYSTLYVFVWVRAGAEPDEKSRFVDFECYHASSTKGKEIFFLISFQCRTFMDGQNDRVRPRVLTVYSL